MMLASARRKQVGISKARSVAQFEYSVYIGALGVSTFLFLIFATEVKEAIANNVPCSNSAARYPTLRLAYYDVSFHSKEGSASATLDLWLRFKAFLSIGRLLCIL